METVPANPDLESKPNSTTIWSRLVNIFAVPGEVFEEVKNSAPRTSNWLVPAVIYIAVGIISALVIFSQPAIVQQIRDQQAKLMDQQVQAGKLTQAQADQALTVMDKFAGPPMLMVFGCVGAVFGSFVHIFWWAFILWLMAQAVLKIKIPFLKAAEIAGLITMIVALGAVFAVLLTVMLGRLGATLSLALLLGNFDMKNKMHLLLAAVNIFSFWQIGVTACGLSRVTGAPFAKALLCVAVYWLAFTLFFIGIGFGQMAM
jgi:Yip1 domain